MKNVITLALLALFGASTAAGQPPGTIAERCRDAPDAVQFNDAGGIEEVIDGEPLPCTVRWSDDITSAPGRESVLSCGEEGGYRSVIIDNRGRILYDSCVNVRISPHANTCTAATRTPRSAT